MALLNKFKFLGKVAVENGSSSLEDGSSSVRKLLCVLCVLVFGASAVQAENKPLRFEAAEHIHAGNLIQLRFDVNRPAVAGYTFTLANGLKLKYGEIISLAGDFYGVPESPIALGQNLAEQKQRFLLAYSTLSVEHQAVDEVPRILAVMQDEQEQLNAGMQKGLKPIDIYKSMSTDHNAAWNCITGGLCEGPGLTKEELRKIYFLKQGRFLKLAEVDFDHFGELAWLAYSAGHQLALEKAVAAHDQKSLSLLEEAYSLNAFASHFLMDGFSSGHMRTPHWLLYHKVTPHTVGALLSSYMHKEEGAVGLNVSNHRGDSWKAYGDGYYFDPCNQRNREILLEALQLSADEVFDVYVSGVVVTADKVSDLFPDIKKLLTLDQNNPSPMFYWDERKQQLLRRRQLNSTQDYSWTPFWSGAATLAELIRDHGVP